jgi:4-hydroxy-tetrahydrodipicolinate synthase
MKMGAKGVVSVASHIVGKQIKNILTSVIDGNISNAEDIHSNLLELFEALFLEPSPGPVKYLLTQSWEDVGNPLLPITSVSPKFMGELDNIFKKIK